VALKIFGISIGRHRNAVTAEPAADQPQPLGAVTAEHWHRLFGGDEATAERIAAVYACVYVIASTIAAMPLQLYRKQGETRSREHDHPLAKFLRGTPNGAMTWTQLREALLYRLVLRGNSYTRNFWKGGVLDEVFPLPGSVVTPKFSTARRSVYAIGENSFHVPAGLFGQADVAHFKGLSCDGLQGISPIEHCRITMQSGVALAQHGLTTAEKGAPLRGVITNAPPFKNPEQAKEVRGRWRDAFREATESGGVSILEGDLKFQPVSMSMRDAEFIAQMRFSVEEIARIFNVPPHKIQMLERATFNNIEHLSREFYTSALQPWIVRIEATMNATWLTAGDRAAGYYLRHNADGLLRGDLKTRSESYAKQISSGIMTPNEARQLEEREPMAGGDQLFFPINHAPLGADTTDPNP